MNLREALSALSAVALPATLGLAAHPARGAADWPRWRGPNADGVADGGSLPTQWSQTENVRWSVE